MIKIHKEYEEKLIIYAPVTFRIEVLGTDKAIVEKDLPDLKKWLAEAVPIVGIGHQYLYFSTEDGSVEVKCCISVEEENND